MGALKAAPKAALDGHPKGGAEGGARWVALKAALDGHPKGSAEGGARWAPERWRRRRR